MFTILHRIMKTLFFLVDTVAMIKIDSNLGAENILRVDTNTNKVYKTKFLKIIKR